MKKSALTLALGLAVVSLAQAAPTVENESNKHINLSEMKDKNDIHAGYATISANNNSVIVENKEFGNNANIYGGRVIAAEGSKATHLSTNNNKVTVAGKITDTDVSDKMRFIVAGQVAAKETVTSVTNLAANNNELVFTGTANLTKNRIYGGRVIASQGSAEARGNIITIGAQQDNNAVTATFLASGSVFLGNTSKYLNEDVKALDASLTDNKIIVAGKPKTDMLMGAYLSTRFKNDGTHGNATTVQATLSNNSVTIQEGASVTGDVYGAYVDSYLVDDNRKNLSLTMANNSVNVERGADVGTAKLYGTYVYSQVNGDKKELTSEQFKTTGNTLNIAGSHTVKEAYNFQNVNVSLNEEDLKGENAAIVFSQHDFKDENTAVLVKVDATNLQNKKIIGLGTNAKDINLRVTSGFLDVAGEIGSDGTFAANGTVTGSNESSILTSALAANATFLQQGTDLLLSHDFKEGAFVVLGGGKTEFDEANLSVDGFNTAFGFNKGWDSNGDRMNVAAFIEYADGSYDATKGASAEGDTSYYGAGLFGRHAMSNGFTGTMSLRFGRADGDFTSQMFGDAVKFDTKSNYVTAHIGGEYAVKLNDAMTVSPFAQYRFAHIGSDNVSAMGYNVELESFRSHRTLLGAALSGALSSAANYRVSLAWEHEFDGEGKARQNGTALQTLDLGGDAAVIEASVNCSPSTMQGWNFGVGLQGRMGNAEGIAGRFTTTYNF